MSDTTYLDWPFFDKTHREFAADLTTWAKKEIAPHENDDHHTNDALDNSFKNIIKKLGEAGWLKYTIPAAYGGALEHFDVRHIALARSILGYHTGIADFAFAMQGLGSGSITLFGSKELKEKYLPDVGTGNRTAAFAISEPECGSDVASMSTEAKLNGNHYVINGVKTWISNAGIADQYVLFARTGDAPGAKGLSAFVVDADNPGLKITERINVIAPHPLGTVTLTDCRVPTSSMLGESGSGFKVAMTTLDIFRTTVGGAALGFARRAMDEAIARAKSREAFGKKISEFQIIQSKIGDMAVKIDAAALLVFRSAWVKDIQQIRVTRESSMAKLYATESAQEVIDEAVQIFGGMGVVSEMTVERLYREIRALRIYEGTSEIQKLVIAGQAMAE